MGIQVENNVNYSACKYYSIEVESLVKVIILISVEPCYKSLGLEKQRLLLPAVERSTVLVSFTIYRIYEGC